MAPKKWFRPKTFGYGYYPVSWQGWACVVTFLLIVWLLAYVALVVLNAIYVYVGGVLFCAGILWFIASRTSSKKEPLFKQVLKKK